MISLDELVAYREECVQIMEGARLAISEIDRHMLTTIRGVMFSMTPLSRRETEILDRIKLSNKEIADQLGISVRTVKFHVSSVLAKHGVHSRNDLFCLSERRIDAGTQS